MVGWLAKNLPSSEQVISLLLSYSLHAGKNTITCHQPWLHKNYFISPVSEQHRAQPVRWSSRLWCAPGSSHSRAHHLLGTNPSHSHYKTGEDSRCLAYPNRIAPPPQSETMSFLYQSTSPVCARSHVRLVLQYFPACGWRHSVPICDIFFSVGSPIEATIDAYMRILPISPLPQPPPPLSAAVFIFYSSIRRRRLSLTPGGDTS